MGTLAKKNKSIAFFKMKFFKVNSEWDVALERQGEYDESFNTVIIELPKVTSYIKHFEEKRFSRKLNNKLVMSMRPNQKRITIHIRDFNNKPQIKVFCVKT